MQKPNKQITRSPPLRHPPPLHSSDDNLRQIVLGILGLAVLLLALLVFSLSQMGNGSIDHGGNSADSKDSTAKSDTGVEFGENSLGKSPDKNHGTSITKGPNQSTAAQEQASEPKGLNAEATPSMSNPSTSSSESGSRGENDQNGEMSSAEKKMYTATVPSHSGVGLLPVDRTVGFFGMSATGSDVAYVVDISSSMSGPRIARAKKELLKAIHQLSKDQTFSIYLFNSSLVFDPELQNCIANPETLKRVDEWTKGIHASGGTNPMPAVAHALRNECDELFLLSDGEFMGNTPPEITNLNKRKAKINAISLQTQSFSLQQIAKQNNGKYRTANN